MHIIPGNVKTQDRSLTLINRHTFQITLHFTSSSLLLPLFHSQHHRRPETAHTKFSFILTNAVDYPYPNDMKCIWTVHETSCIWNGFSCVRSFLPHGIHGMWTATSWKWNTSGKKENLFLNFSLSFCGNDIREAKPSSPPLPGTGTSNCRMLLYRRTKQHVLNVSVYVVWFGFT